MHAQAAAVTALAAIVLVGVLALLAYELIFRYRRLLSARIEEISGKGKNNANASLFKDLKQLDAGAGPTHARWRARLRNIVERADLPISVGSVLGFAIGGGVVVGMVAAVLSRRWWIAPIGLGIGFLGAVGYVWAKCRIRTRRLVQQLPEAFEAMGRAVRAGQTVAAAFQIIGDDFEQPLSGEFRRCYEEQNLGMPYEIALRNLAARTGIMELRILVVALLVQCRAGGNLTELLSNLATMARKRVKLQQKVKALTGEGRMQAVVLTVLPVIAFASLLVIAPTYVATLLERPWLLFTTATAQVAGSLWIRHIVNFEY
jgi:tight adherence protein B